MRLPFRSLAWSIGVAVPMLGLLPGAPLAQAEFCNDPQGYCAPLLDATCLEAAGAGTLSVGAAGGAAKNAADGTDCVQQLNQYRDCLTQVATECPAPEERGGSASVDQGVLEALAALGGVIADPKTVTEYYNNALVFQRRGDALSARRMYEKAITEGADYIDVLDGHAALVKAQEGLLGAREIYADLRRQQPDNRSIALTAATLAPANRREEALRSLVEGDDPFEPAWYEISRLFSLDRLGDQSLADKRSEKAALEAFVSADEAGRIYRWFLDKSAAEAWREDAQRRYAAYRNRDTDFDAVTINASPSNDGWTITLFVAEAARAIRYRVNGGEVRDTGKLDMIDQRTGAPAPRTYFALPLGTETAQIEIWYDDVRDVERGPFPVTFSAAQAFADFTYNVMENLTQGWVEGRAWDENRFLIYFSHLVSYRCGLDEIRYGLDRDDPDQLFPMSPCDPKNPYASGVDDQLFLDLKVKPEKIIVQLKYADGRLSDMREFRFD
ncbi:MAG: hypothetical protein AAFW88_01205 [Pseudomonadota bacterium]